MTFESLLTYIGLLVMFCLVIVMFTMGVTHMAMDKETREKVKNRIK